MKKQMIFLLAGVFVSSQAQAFLNFGGNYSKNYYVIQNKYDDAYLGIDKLADAIKELANSTEEVAKGVKEGNWNNKERERVSKYYNLDRIGKNIGIDLNSSFIGKVAQEGGVAGVQALIEDRILYLHTNLKLAKALEFSLENSGDASKKDLDISTSLQKLNTSCVVSMIDFVRRNPQLGSVESLKEEFLKSTKNLNPSDKQVLRGRNLSKGDNEKMTEYLFHMILSGLEGDGPQVDFAGIEHNNLEERSEAIDEIANTFNRNVADALKSIQNGEAECAGKPKEVKVPSEKDASGPIAEACHNYFKVVEGKTGRDVPLGWYGELNRLEDKRNSLISAAGRLVGIGETKKELDQKISALRKKTAAARPLREIMDCYICGPEFTLQICLERSLSATPDGKYTGYNDKVSAAKDQNEKAKFWHERMCEETKDTVVLRDTFLNYFSKKSSSTAKKIEKGRQ